MNDLYFTAKNKKRLAILITFAESVYHPSENEYISLLDEYIINAKHCISSNRRGYTPGRDDIQPKRADDIHHTSCGDDMPNLRFG